MAVAYQLGHMQITCTSFQTSSASLRLFTGRMLLTPNQQRENAEGNKSNSESMNWTPVFHTTGGDTRHYTNRETSQY